jgi:[acyl-carrier-protein] S-malonyltransferase
MSGTAFLFPGQGAQAVGMGRQLCETLPAARKLFEEASAILGYDLAEVCFNGPAEKLNSTVISQPALFVTCLAALESLKATDSAVHETCKATAGLSLGEYTALVFAGAMSFTDGVRLVQRRGQAMQAAADATPSGMVSVIAMEQPKVEELCAQARSAGTIELANFLCPGNIAVSGSSAAIERLTQLVQEAGGKTVKLAVAGAFHTTIMKPADEALAGALGDVKMQAPRVPVWSNVDAQPHTDPEEIRRLLVQQIVNPVLWEQSMRNLLAAGIHRFYELGPGRVLAGLLKRVQRKVECQNISAT